jgi:hypothetical protein
MILFIVYNYTFLGFIGVFIQYLINKIFIKIVINNCEKSGIDIKIDLKGIKTILKVNDYIIFIVSLLLITSVFLRYFLMENIKTVDNLF